MGAILLIGLVACGLVLGVCVVYEAFKEWEDFFK